MKSSKDRLLNLLDSSVVNLSDVAGHIGPDYHKAHLLYKLALKSIHADLIEARDACRDLLRDRAIGTLDKSKLGNEREITITFDETVDQATADLFMKVFGDAIRKRETEIEAAEQRAERLAEEDGT